VHRSPDICLTAEENPRIPQLGDRLMKGLFDQSFSQMESLSSVGSRSTLRREKEGISRAINLKSKDMIQQKIMM